MAAYYAKDTPVQGVYHIKTSPRLIYGGLAVPEQPHRKQGPGNHRDEYKCKHHQYISKYAGMYVIADIQVATQEDTYLQKLKIYITQGWAHKNEEVEHMMRQYWSIRSEMEMIDGITMKGERIMIPSLLQKQILQQKR